MAKKAITRPTRAQLMRLEEGAATALALCGYKPFGNAQSIRHRLDAVRGRQKTLKTLIPGAAKRLGKDDPILKGWQYEAGLLPAVLAYGKQFLNRIIAMPEAEEHAYNESLSER